jgi:hypothetical protein
LLSAVPPSGGVQLALGLLDGLDQLLPAIHLAE